MDASKTSRNSVVVRRISFPGTGIQGARITVNAAKKYTNISPSTCAENFRHRLYLGKDYTYVSGTNHATDALNSGQIAVFGKEEHKTIMVNHKGIEKAVPSTLTSHGTSFTVDWKFE